jgi:hypothetical protein
MVAAIGSGQGRSSHAACGSAVDSAVGGISYCNGPGGPFDWSNHEVSYYANSDDASQNPFVGCNGHGCSGVTCGFQVLVWLK